MLSPKRERSAPARMLIYVINPAFWPALNLLTLMAHKSFPDDVAYEFTKFWVDIAPKLAKLHGLLIYGGSLHGLAEPQNTARGPPMINGKQVDDRKHRIARCSDSSSDANAHKLSLRVHRSCPRRARLPQGHPSRGVLRCAWHLEHISCA